MGLRWPQAALVCASLAAGLSAAAPAHAQGAAPVKIGFVVKQPDDPWFQDEWRFAEQAAKDKHFTLVKIAAPSGEKVSTALDSLAAQKAQGVIICAPDVKLGPGIAAKARRYGMKLMSVDDQLVDGRGAPLADVPHMGISAYRIGRQVGDAIAAEAKRRGWNPAEVGVLRLAYDQLPTARERTTGAVDALKAAGFAAANVVDAPEMTADTEGAFNAANIAFTKHRNFKHWVAFGSNDDTTVGAVRAGEGRGIVADDMIAVGINGSQVALNEFAKPKPTGFFGSILLNPRLHGYDTSVNMYDWITQNRAPPPVVLTSGTLITRANEKTARAQLGL
ncbi:arabinose ABC transporter substrate-binding protein [Burkholderia pseudomallei]|uniref:arabinose ABC transporter substrate-binding protein n=1 Tax=Burkholderia pseudomallei TaxID=28450 RepID=UPI0009767621|nr:arabinose ABC transporter substrate-binding protein [Burkholderia pseudomallei]MBD2919835.1 arabinose ABC transporter substrate-binding protein [Burkholderia pseudomallei]MBD2999265.1 arabinose ABC transporter substrate-binding protein [Burkholderia pseudomallei]MXP98229.1 substrate-binding domain-containing protein [Burkholderia pseudomallei]MXQ35974.1 substrate-binding domain-containing protein [Burkholderia pseudomallei]OMR47496.1 sugar ABC transporter substrate-binding protein [Burkhold